MTTLTAIPSAGDSGSGTTGWKVNLSPASVAASHAYCRELTRRCARNFYYGLRLTPPAQRSAMFAIYAWMRGADDIADRPGDMGEKQRELADFQTLTHALHQGRHVGDEPLGRLAQQELWPAIADTFHGYTLPVDTLDDMIAGQLLDQVKTRYANFDELYDYCYKVASTVGLTCVRLWGFEGEDDTLRLAEQRGVGLQLTNILRDLVEDARRDRIYLPHDELTRFGLDEATFLQMVLHNRPDERLDSLIAFQIRRAQAYYQLSSELESHLTPACRSTSWALMKIYHGLLEKIAADPRGMLRRRIRLSSLHKVGIAVAAVLRSYEDAVPKRHAPARPARPYHRSG
ncbi:MAG: phytoene/squalene synthase family protein, partial [Phycisphaeraceae bacterium]|nr:phytoene/squalene synthase family protein [Phycisphaeraceae bacterium]